MEKFMKDIYLYKMVICLITGGWFGIHSDKSMVFWFSLTFLYAVLHLDKQINSK